jgi:type II secretory pathway pseudopilin PulG
MRWERVSRSIRRRSSVAAWSSGTARSQHATPSRGQPRANGNARTVVAGRAARLVSAGPSCAISVSVSAAATGSEGEGSASSVGGGGPRPLAAADPPDDEPPRAGHFPPRGALMPGLRLCEIVCAGVAPRARSSLRTAPRLRRAVRALRAVLCAVRRALRTVLCAQTPVFALCFRTANPVFALPPRTARAHIALPPSSAIAEPAQCEPNGAHWAGTPSHCDRAVRNFPAQCERVGMVCYVGLVCGTFLLGKFPCMVGRSRARRPIAHSSRHSTRPCSPPRSSSTWSQLVPWRASRRGPQPRE